jgi:hypothetical protein
MELNTDELLLARTWDGYTAFRMAAEKNHVETQKIIWAWAEEGKLNSNELKNNMFLSRDLYGYVVRNRAALVGSLETLESIWSSTKEMELNAIELLLAKNWE